MKLFPTFSNFIKKVSFIHVILVTILLLSCSAFAQKTISLVPLFNQKALKLDLYYLMDNKIDSIQFRTIKFYMSNITLLQDSAEVHTLEKQHVLVDLANNKSQIIDIDIENEISYNKIQFDLGIDPITSESGVFGGDLDPTNGMYWTWQSGYINFKIEGNSTTCPTQNHEFQFHIGGYQEPYNTSRIITLPLQQKENIVIQLELSTLFSQINFSETSSIMSPNQKAMKMADKLTTIFRTTL
ncbi:hypothetical protein GCM10022393_03640 [Aquimarina addita]|uniref:Copper-binding protein MbnP-like domain-containing protein n=1 Tax=Aquimarina addita TaxID=870485 RepID=A0ABP7X961_9FLAO